MQIALLLMTELNEISGWQTPYQEASGSFHNLVPRVVLEGLVLSGVFHSCNLQVGLHTVRDAKIPSRLEYTNIIIWFSFVSNCIFFFTKKLFFLKAITIL